jgi:hypothetical protein
MLQSSIPNNPDENQNEFPMEFIMDFFPRILVLSKFFSHFKQDAAKQHPK